MRLFRNDISRGIGNYDDNVLRMKKEIEAADAIIMCAGSCLSTSAGFTMRIKNIKFQ